MNESLSWFWAAMVFSSVAWYAFLLFYVGGKGGHEIVQMTKDLQEQGTGDRGRGTGDGN